MRALEKKAIKISIFFEFSFAWLLLFSDRESVGHKIFWCGLNHGLSISAAADRSGEADKCPRLTMTWNPVTEAGRPYHEKTYTQK